MLIAALALSGTESAARGPETPRLLEVPTDAGASHVSHPITGIPTAKIALRLRVIQATDDGQYFDPRLDDLRYALKRFRHRTYRETADEKVLLDSPEERTINLPSCKCVHVSLVSLESDAANIRVVLDKTGESCDIDRSADLAKVGIHTLLDVKAAIAPKKSFFIAGPHDETGTLLIVIEADYDARNIPEQFLVAPTPAAGRELPKAD